MRRSLFKPGDPSAVQFTKESLERLSSVFYGSEWDGKSSILGLCIPWPYCLLHRSDNVFLLLQKVFSFNYDGYDTAGKHVHLSDQYYTVGFKLYYMIGFELYYTFD